MNVTTETMNLACGDSMLEAVPGGMMDGGMIQEMMSTGMMGGGDMLSVIQTAVASMTQMMQGGMMDGGMMGGFMGPWMMLIPLLVLIGFLVFAVWIVRTLMRDTGGGRSGGDALEVARQRYARGEIDREEFERIRSDLASG